ncbi:centromere protein J isoform X2 [Echeneis naucrates]|uniref:centromere protein J isoform X2 n=1 Tax=Echeneis naucrates TaxID=173247 RepID=UPI00111433D9|nr:centromere protein J isoform X2 [Echeneis naucrates]
MSSPAGLQSCSSAHFLARWMPSSSRAGVILNPTPDLAGSLRHISAVGSPPPEPDGSFASDFAPLPASVDSSCVGGFARPAGGERSGTDRPLYGPHRDSDGQLDSLDEMESKSQDLPLMVKLEELRKWQQHMQEQLKAHQLEELLQLQEEQQRLLGMMNESQHNTGDHSERSELSGAEWEESLLQETSHYRESPYRPPINCFRIPPSSNCGFRQEQQLSLAQRRDLLSKGQQHKGPDDNEDGTWTSRDNDDMNQSDATSSFQEHDDTLKQIHSLALSEDRGRKEDTPSDDRPIKPGIGGHKQTFEELLEEQLKLEEQRQKSAQQQQSQDGPEAVQPPPKRAFLKRGEGLSRFTNNGKISLPKKEMKKDSKPAPQAKVVTRSNSEPAAVPKGGTNGLQRKTAILNKENKLRNLNSPPQDIRAESKTARMKVLGSHQKQNTEGSESAPTDPEGRQTKQGQLRQVKEQNNRTVSGQTLRKPDPHRLQPNPVTKQVGLLESCAAKDKSSGSKVESAERRAGSEAAAGGHGLPLDSFELSFQEKLQRWECDRQLESMELGEFELLEQAAEELSFSSNSSFVMKLLQMDQHHQQLQSAQGLHQRRLSSTPIKSPPRGVLQRCHSLGSGGGLASKSMSVNSEGFGVKMRDDAVKSKVNSKERQDMPESGRGNKDKKSDVSSCGGSECEDQEMSVKPPLFPSTFTFPAQFNPPYDKRSYQDEDSCRDSDVTQDGDGESGTVLSNDESTLTDDKHEQEGKVVFDDDDTWNDLEETAVDPHHDTSGVGPVSDATANPVSAPERTLLRKVAVSKAVEPDKGTVVGSANLDLDPPPPVSQLMTRLFPSLKPKTQNASLPPPAVSFAPESKKPAEEAGQQVQSLQLRERLVQLEIEIERFKQENAVLTKLRQENEKKQETLRKERLEFEQTKADELAKFEEYKREETKKLQKERKLFEKHAAAARAIPDKKEREEIQALKQQLSSLQEELRRKESRWSSTHSRLRQQINSLSQENGALQDEVRMLEKLRLSALKKSPVNAQKDKETKDGSGLFPNNIPSVTKGVKFASPLDSRGGSSSSSSSSSPPQSSTAAASQTSSGEINQPAAGMKSSLRRPSMPATTTSSSSVPGRRTEERSASADKSQDKQPQQEESNSSSPKRDSPPKEPECSEAEEAEPAEEIITHSDGKVEKVLRGGDRIVIFPNGTRKEVSADGQTLKVTFFNGDTKQVTADQTVIYYYSEAQTTHITYPDGLEVLHFPNNQTEKLFPDGRKEITFPDQTVKNLFPDGREESVLTDGTVIQVNPDGTKEILFNTGQKEIHTADYKRREYPDGTVKTVYSDGRQETRYPTGRLRIKDKDGNVVLDHRT